MGIKCRAPISTAACGDHADYLKLLLVAGGVVNNCDSSRMFAALIAFQFGHAHVFEVCVPDLAQLAISQSAIMDAEYCAVVEIHRAAGTVVINRHRGFGKLTADYLMCNFKYSTLLLPTSCCAVAVFTLSSKLFKLLALCSSCFARRVLSSVEILGILMVSAMTNILGQ